VFENTFINNHAIMLPPKALGTVTYIAPKGSYDLNVYAYFSHVFLARSH
jgi:V-type H+-transporting ATPase subunit A